MSQPGSDDCCSSATPGSRICEKIVDRNILNIIRQFDADRRTKFEVLINDFVVQTKHQMAELEEAKKSDERKISQYFSNLGCQLPINVMNLTLGEIQEAGGHVKYDIHNVDNIQIFIPSKLISRPTKIPNGPTSTTRNDGTVKRGNRPKTASSMKTALPVATTTDGKYTTGRLLRSSSRLLDSNHNKTRIRQNLVEHSVNEIVVVDEKSNKFLTPKVLVKQDSSKIPRYPSSGEEIYVFSKSGTPLLADNFIKHSNSK